MKCIHLKSNGNSCAANAMKDSQYCFSHNPETKADKELAVLKGGLAPKPRKDVPALPPLPLKTAADITNLLEDTVNRIRVEPLTHQTANCIGYLCGVLVKSLEVGRLEEQLKIMQSVLNRK